MTQVGKVENANLDDWRYVFELNFWAGLYTARAAIPALKAGGGDIVNISSTAGRRAVGATFGPYAASKFALTAFNESLRAEVTLAGIRVCIIEPGATATEIHEHIKDEKVREFTRQHVEKDGAMQARGRRGRHRLRGQPAAPGERLAAGDPAVRRRPRAMTRYRPRHRPRTRRSGATTWTSTSSTTPTRRSRPTPTGTSTTWPSTSRSTGSRITGW